MNLRPDLPDVTLVAVTSVAVDQTLQALRASMGHACFGKILFLSNRRPSDAHPDVQWHDIQPLRSKADYSRFMLRNLADYIETSHALCIQWDGYVIAGERWNPAFLAYDYIGAPWLHFDDGYNVGNGGFSLRSRRLLHACKKLPLHGDYPEDVVIARLCRPLLEEQGMRFAPENLARGFAYERAKPTGHEFGFHGAFNLVRRLGRRQAETVFRDLEPDLLSRNERWELFRWALAHGRLSLAHTLFHKLF